MLFFSWEKDFCWNEISPSKHTWANLSETLSWFAILDLKKRSIGKATWQLAKLFNTIAFIYKMYHMMILVLKYRILLAIQRQLQILWGCGPKKNWGAVFLPLGQVKCDISECELGLNVLSG